MKSANRLRYSAPSAATLAVAAIVALCVSAVLAFSKPVEVRIDGQPLISDVPPVRTIKSEVYVPLRSVSDALGAETTYERKSGDVAIARGEQTLHLHAGTTRATLNGMPLTLKHAPFRVRGRTMVSLKTVQQAFGVRVHFDKRTSRVEVNTPGVPEQAAE